MLVAREGEPGIDDDRILSVLEHGHVLAHLAETAERDDTENGRRHRRSVSASGTLSRRAAPRTRSGEPGKIPLYGDDPWAVCSENVTHADLKASPHSCAAP